MSFDDDYFDENRDPYQGYDDSYDYYPLQPFDVPDITFISQSAFIPNSGGASWEEIYEKIEKRNNFVNTLPESGLN